MGGTVNPETGELEWTMHVPLAEQIAYYRAHPPTALAGLTAKPVEVAREFDGHGEPINIVFELTCACGGALFTVIAWIEDDAWRPPIALECAGCAAEHQIYDRSRHGYDGVMGDLPADDPGEDAHPDSLEPEHADMPHQVLVRFEFPSDHLGGGDPDLQGREHDLFSWITILARDPESGGLEVVFDDECA
jgi:hypothetical protein